jgi:hypothetical protein
MLHRHDHTSGASAGPRRLRRARDALAGEDETDVAGAAPNRGAALGRGVSKKRF